MFYLIKQTRVAAGKNTSNRVYENILFLSKRYNLFCEKFFLKQQSGKCNAFTKQRPATCPGKR
jgi:hypothetical protein